MCVLSHYLLPDALLRLTRPRLSLAVCNTSTSNTAPWLLLRYNVGPVPTNVSTSFVLILPSDQHPRISPYLDVFQLEWYLLSCSSMFFSCTVKIFQQTIRICRCWRNKARQILSTWSYLCVRIPLRLRRSVVARTRSARCGDSVRWRAVSPSNITIHAVSDVSFL